MREVAPALRGKLRVPVASSSSCRGGFVLPQPKLVQTGDEKRDLLATGISNESRKTASQRLWDGNRIANAI